ncbi:MAG: DUF1553 domain-containing protein [Planctomycetia bacterium]|nr:DUF1553 domain-containing protein [Planctomycetia bacterium]
MLATRKHLPRRMALLLGVACWALWMSIAVEAQAPAENKRKTETHDLWSLAPVVRSELPLVKNIAWCKTPIDRFVLPGLEAKHWEPASPISRERLIRRAYFDLWGLPPSPEAVRTFVAEASPGAYERLIDDLLASPHYGERYARYWLDLVRFAETNGYERDALKPNAWQYRDWVIQSLNEDKPYDRFVLEQLAGDELPDASDSTRIATGFLRIGTFDDEPNDPLKYKFEQLDDLIHATSTAFLAITLKCARCHDHKFDPIPQTDYYAVLNFFAGGNPAEGPLLAYTDAGPQAPAVQLLQGGDPTRPGPTVAPGFLSMATAVTRAVDPPAPDAKTTGRRTQLARWITDPRNPLTARVIVNRLWQHHFGEGLVRTPDNFGMLSSPPTHPELLDYLASELVEAGWRLKRLHRLILLSNAYQMDSTHPREAEYSRADFANTLWWRANRRRLESEPLRDAMLTVSGQLNPKVGGPSFFPPATKESLEGLSKKGAEWGQSPPDEQSRRSVYMMTKRSLLLPLMTTFDFTDTTQPCSQRNVSTVAPQALALLNNDFVHQQSGAFAARVIAEAGKDQRAQIERAWWLALGRAPNDQERQAAVGHLAAQRKHLASSAAKDQKTLENGEVERLVLASLCHVLFNLNEFIYVD